MLNMSECPLAVQEFKETGDATLALVWLRQCLDSGEYAEIHALLESPENEELLKATGYDLLPMCIDKIIAEDGGTSTPSSRFSSLMLWRLVQLLVERCSCKEMCLAFAEVLESRVFNPCQLYLVTGAIGTVLCRFSATSWHKVFGMVSGNLVMHVERLSPGSSSLRNAGEKLPTLSPILCDRCQEEIVCEDIAELHRDIRSSAEPLLPFQARWSASGSSNCYSQTASKVSLQECSDESCMGVLPLARISCSCATTPGRSFQVCSELSSSSLQDADKSPGQVARGSSASGVAIGCRHGIMCQLVLIAHRFVSLCTLHTRKMTASELISTTGNLSPRRIIFSWICDLFSSRHVRSLLSIDGIYRSAFRRCGDSNGSHTAKVVDSHIIYDLLALLKSLDVSASDLMEHDGVKTAALGHGRPASVPSRHSPSNNGDDASSAPMAGGGVDDDGDSAENGDRVLSVVSLACIRRALLLPTLERVFLPSLYRPQHLLDCSVVLLEDLLQSSQLSSQELAISLFSALIDRFWEPIEMDSNGGETYLVLAQCVCNLIKSSEPGMLQAAISCFSKYMKLFDIQSCIAVSCSLLQHSPAYPPFIAGAVITNVTGALASISSQEVRALLGLQWQQFFTLATALPESQDTWLDELDRIMPGINLVRFLLLTPLAGNDKNFFFQWSAVSKNFIEPLWSFLQVCTKSYEADFARLRHQVQCQDGDVAMEEGSSSTSSQSQMLEMLLQRTHMVLSILARVNDIADSVKEPMRPLQ